MSNFQNQSKSKPKHVEELKHFPFKTFNEMRDRITEGVASIGVNRSIAMQWIQNGIYTSKWQRTQAILLAFIPYIVALGFIIFIIISSNWLLLLALPVLIIGFFIFYPGSAVILGFIRTGFIGLTLFGLVWGITNEISWLIALSLSLTIIWLAQRTIYRKAVDGLISACLQHEDLLCLLWNERTLNIWFYNGDSYWVDWKKEGEKNITYDKK